MVLGEDATPIPLVDTKTCPFPGRALRTNVKSQRGWNFSRDGSTFRRAVSSSSAVPRFFGDAVMGTFGSAVRSCASCSVCSSLRFLVRGVFAVQPPFRRSAGCCAPAHLRGSPAARHCCLSRYRYDRSRAVPRRRCCFVCGKQRQPLNETPRKRKSKEK